MNLFAFFLAASAMFIPEFSMKDLRFLGGQDGGRMDRENLWSASLIELLIAPDGKVADCIVVRFAGDKKTADLNCKILKKRRFSIPIGPDGKPAYAVIPTVLTSYADKLFPMRQQLTRDFISGLKADKLPMSIEVPMTVFVEGFSTAPASSDPAGKGAVLSVAMNISSAVNLRIGLDGKVSDCEGTARAPESLIHYACTKAKLMNFETRKIKGRPVPYLRLFQIFPIS